MRSARFGRAEKSTIVVNGFGFPHDDMQQCVGRSFSTEREARRTMATPASCPLCGGSFPSKNALFKHLRDENVATGGECGSWCVKHGGVTEAARKIAAGELEEPTFSPPPPSKPREAKASKKKASTRGTRSSGHTPPGKDGESGGPGEDVSATSGVFVPECPGLPNELWVGGIPATHASRRRVSQILYCAIPGNVGIAVPAVRHVVRRGWRESARKHGVGSAGDGENVVADVGDATNAGDAKKPKGAWLGYAFVAFRDAEEAAQAMLHVDGKVVRETTSDGDPVTITLSARPATIKGHRRRSRSRSDAAADGGEEKTRDDADDDAVADDDDDARTSVPLAPGADPSRFAIARAWPRSVLARRAETLGYHTVEAYLAAEKAASDAKTNKSLSPPPKAQKPLPSPTYTRVRGAPIPPRLLENLRFALENTRWPAASHRRGVEAQKYLLVSSTPRAMREAERALKKTEKDPKTAASDPDPYGALKRAAHRVLVWADPAFEYDRLAVTKNFTGSPHVDKDDVTFQYALSLGDFAQSGGGELVVESESGDERWVVETRNRVARVDGRFAHWVRGYDTTPRVSVSGDGIRGDEPGTNPRYSVIFYANKPSAATARLHPPADAGFVPAGTRGDGDGDGDARERGKRAGASLGAVGGTGGSPPGISTALVKCFAAILGIGMALRSRRRTSAGREGSA